jgi:hypothetical protein
MQLAFISDPGSPFRWLSAITGIVAIIVLAHKTQNSCRGRGVGLVRYYRWWPGRWRRGGPSRYVVGYGGWGWGDVQSEPGMEGRPKIEQAMT